MNVFRQILIFLLFLFSKGLLAAVPVSPSLYSPVGGVTVGQSNVGFDWNDPAGATKYRLVISQNASFSGFTDNNGSGHRTQPRQPPACTTPSVG
ncbi:MAG: hypothetical protein RI964_3290 [Pseudomonadota bacterium]